MLIREPFELRGIGMAGTDVSGLYGFKLRVYVESVRAEEFGHRRCWSLWSLSLLRMDFNEVLCRAWK